MTRARPALARLALATLALAILAAAACTRAATNTAPPPDPGAPQTSDTLAPIRNSPGERLDLVVPLSGGDALPLAQLRGRVVVLELTSAEGPGWPETFAFYNRLLREFGPDRLAVVVVSVDPERAALSPEPDVRAHGFELGWDPQGALGARLQAAALPTVIVLDRDGRIFFVQAGPAEGRARSLADSVRAALAPANN